VLVLVLVFLFRFVWLFCTSASRHLALGQPLTVKLSFVLNEIHAKHIRKKNSDTIMLGIFGVQISEAYLNSMGL